MDSACTQCGTRLGPQAPSCPQCTLSLRPSQIPEDALEEPGRLASNVVASVAVSMLLFWAAFTVAGMANRTAASEDEVLMSMPSSTLILIPASVQRDRSQLAPHCYDPSAWDGR